MNPKSLKDFRAIAEKSHRNKLRRYAEGGSVDDLGGPSMGDLLNERNLGGPSMGDLITRSKRNQTGQISDQLSGSNAVPPRGKKTTVEDD